MRLIRYAELKSRKGVSYSRQHLQRLERAGKWPKRIRYVEGGDYFGYDEDEIDAHLAERAAARSLAQRD